MKGPELLQFVEKHTADEEARQKRILEREERAADRELRKLELERQAKGEAEQNALKKFELERQAKVEALDLERQAKAEAEANAMKKLDLERQAKAEADECAMRKLELERKMKTEAHEQALEMQKEQHEQSMALEKAKLEGKSVRQASIRSVSENAASEEDGEEEEEEERTSDFTVNARKGPKLPPFEDGKDNMDAYLRRFEKYASIRKWKRQEWAVYLAALLKGRALDVFARMPPEQYDDYDALKDALLKRYQMTEEGFHKRFNNCRPETGEAPQQFITRLESYLLRWIELAKVTQDFEGLKSLLVKEQYLSVVSRELSLFLRERAPKDLQELAKLAETYIEAHDGKSKQPYQSNYGEKEVRTEGKFLKPDFTKETERTGKKDQKRNGANDRPCFFCNRYGHSYNSCRFRMNTTQKAAGMQTSWKPRNARQNQKQKVESREDKSTSYAADKKTHKTTATSTDPERTQVKEGCNENADQALKIMSDGEDVELRCGCKAHIIAEACRPGKYGTDMKTTIGYVGDQQVEVLRDTGCSSVVVARRLVKKNQMTGKHELCILIDKTTRKVPTAIIEVRTDYFTGKVKALCMKETLYDLVIGNISGAVLRPRSFDKSTEVHERDLLINAEKDEVRSEEQLNVTTAVETRHMKEKAKALPKQLRVPEFQNEVTLETLKKEQAEDSSLKKSWEYSTQEKTTGTNDDDRIVRFDVERGLLYRKFRSPHHNFGDEVKQLVIPSRLRTRVMEVAHCSILGGHLGIHKTQERILSQFFWPGCYSDIGRYCRSCDICQRTLPKGRVQKVPLIKMPIIDTVFKRCVVDLIGPLPCSERGHRYILTLVDCASRYPECIALKQIDTCSVAEALLSIFSRMGAPSELLSDNGSQFTGEMMKEVGRLLSIKQLFSTPYHSQNCGLVERYNGVIKQMLRKMCAEKVKDWDRYLDPLMFAYREVSNESTGFSPFEMIYGRPVRGSMAILKELWTKDIAEPEAKTTYEYVVDLRNRLQETCHLAQENLQRAADKYKRHFDKHAKPRKFDPGDKVLLLLPTESNKLKMQWKGPFQVLKRFGEADYVIQFPHRAKTFHANMLKRYYERQPEIENRSNEEAVNDEMQAVGAAVVVEELSDAEMSLTGEGNLPLFNNLQRETYKDVEIGHDLSADQKKDVENLLEEFQDIFSDVPGRTNLVRHRIQLTSNVPVRKRPYPVPYAMRQELDKEIDDMIRLGVIEPSTAAYASPMLLVRKSDGSNRPCVDFRDLNQITVFDAEPMPQADEIFAKLAGDKFFSKFDLSKGYWGIEVEPESRDCTSFITHRGLYRFVTMPFGLVTAPSTFSRAMRKLLDHSQNLDNYLDDVLCHTVGWPDHLSSLRDFFARVRRAGLTLRPTKCQIGEPGIDFLGHKISDGMIQPRAEKIEKIAGASRPETKKQIRSYLGLIGYYQKFIPNFASIAAPLTELTKKNQPNKVSWGDAQEVAFQELKQHLMNYPILRLPDWTAEFILQTDASNSGAGAVLLQEVDGVKHPIAYASRKFLPRETRYSTIEREGLAIVWALQKFQVYLFGKHFWLETDHQPLIHIQRANPVNGRLMRWALILQPYCFTIRSIKGSENVGADFFKPPSVGLNWEIG